MPPYSLKSLACNFFIILNCLCQYNALNLWKPVKLMSKKFDLVNRNGVVAVASLTGALTLGGLLAGAVEYPTKTYVNERYHTKVSYPADFETQYGQISGERQVVAFVDPKSPDVSASIVFSAIPGGSLITVSR
jgi:hypothetical protein